jgi:hypothetical protein
MQAVQDAAELTGIKAKIVGDIARRCAVTLLYFI